jgi:hypothetical protein
VDGSVRVLVRFRLLPPMALVVCLVPVRQAIERHRPPLTALLRGAGRGSLDSCSINSTSSTSRGDGGGGRVAVLPAAACHHSAFHASFGVQCVGDHARVGGADCYAARAWACAAACCFE